jgi:hypothetical protein
MKRITLLGDGLFTGCSDGVILSLKLFYKKLTKNNLDVICEDVTFVENNRKDHKGK